MKVSTYQSCMDWLFNQFPAYQNKGAQAYKPGLAHILELLKLLNISINQLPYIHVAGTNGKGTTCALMASALTEANYKVGLFTSPHITNFSERIRVNGIPISAEEVVAFVEHVKGLKLEFSPSFFEITWAMALAHFNAMKCDIAVIETGLGGRLDATNVITPLVSVITSIGLDHMDLLGDTRALIAQEKAGIIKLTVPVVLGEYDNEILPVFERIANEKKAPILKVDSLKKATYLVKNKMTARLALKEVERHGFLISDEQFKNGVEQIAKNTGHRGRFQIIQENPVVVVDAAHNTHGVAELLSTLEIEFPNASFHFLWGAAKDKDHSAIYNLVKLKGTLYVTVFENPRSMQQVDWVNFFQEQQCSVEIFSSPKTALNSIKTAVNKRDIIIVLGSFFLLEEIF